MYSSSLGKLIGASQNGKSEMALCGVKTTNFRSLALFTWV